MVEINSMPLVSVILEKITLRKPSVVFYLRPIPRLNCWLSMMAHQIKVALLLIRPHPWMQGLPYSISRTVECLRQEM